MNRTDRLYAIVEELRVRRGRPLSASALADRFEVSSRTIERDILALQGTGVPIWAQPGRSGGYALDASRTMPPVAFTPAEAVAVAVALEAAAATPLPLTARAALTKMLAVMSEADVGAARDLASRILVVRPESSTEWPQGPPQESSPGPAAPTPALARVLEQAIVARRVVRLTYVDRTGAITERVVEPVAVIGRTGQWYLSAWCRLREGHRPFRFDRIRAATLLTETAPARPVSAPVAGAPRASPVAGLA